MRQGKAGGRRSRHTCAPALQTGQGSGSPGTLGGTAGLKQDPRPRPQGGERKGRPRPGPRCAGSATAGPPGAAGSGQNRGSGRGGTTGAGGLGGPARERQTRAWCWLLRGCVGFSGRTPCFAGPCAHRGKTGIKVTRTRRTDDRGVTRAWASTEPVRELGMKVSSGWFQVTLGRAVSHTGSRGSRSAAGGLAPGGGGGPAGPRRGAEGVCSPEGPVPTLDRCSGLLACKEPWLGAGVRERPGRQTRASPATSSDARAEA